MQKRPQRRVFCHQMIESASEKVVELRLGMIRLNGRLKQLAAIRCEQGACVISTELLPPVADGHLPQRVKLTTSRPGKGDLATEKKIKLPGEWAFRSPRTFGHRLDQPILF